MAVRGFVYIVLVVGTLVTSFAQSSVLAEGSWFKVGISESGIYKIDRGTLTALGVTSIGDPRQIQVFGNGVKGILPQANSMERPIDLIENPIQVVGESDGSFDPDDYILFYGVGPHRAQWTSEGFDYRRNIYSDTAYYFLRVGVEDGKRIEARPGSDEAPSVTARTFADHIAFEEDVRNVVSSGRNWIGNSIASGSQYEQVYAIEGISSEIQGFFIGVSQSPATSEMRVAVDGQEVGAFSMDAIRTGASSLYSIKASETSASFTLPQAADFTLSIGYESSGLNARGFLDRYVLTFERNLRLYGNETDFRVTSNLGQVIQYEVGNGEEIQLWNVTTPGDYFAQDYSLTQGNAVFKSSSETVEEFVAFRGNDFPSPMVYGSVANQNLRAETNFDGIIIAPPIFLEEAERLAAFHRTTDGLTVKVVTPSQVYNEFSSGRQDVSALRDYARYVYETGGSLKYLLLFGDCSYEYKYRLSSNTNFVPTYESRESYDPIYSYSSDDYFAFFEEDEGEWIEFSSGDHTMEIGVGRLPVKTAAEASQLVDKIIYYVNSPNTLGRWRNDITYLADDGDGNTHARHVEELSEIIDTTYAQYSINKLLLDAFDQISDGARDSSPETTQSLKAKIKEGTFLINYIGHGNEQLWTAEEVLTNEDIAQMTNGNKLPIFVTATCEFGRYDDPQQVSGAEQLLLLRQGGGIALLTTSRPVFASTNFELNEAFHENIFKRENGSPRRLGDIIRSTKNEGLAGAVNRNFTLLGDPMMMPSFPEQSIEIDDFELDTLSALEEVTLSGRIFREGVFDADFNGPVYLTIYDTKVNFLTQGQESSPFSYALRSNALFRGEAQVTDGGFEFTFLVPKNISYQYDRGKMTLYAFDEERNVDAAGSSRDFVIGGTATEIIEDTDPPLVTLYMNDPSFKNGGVIGKNALFIADISDESGITTARSGVVEGITLELNEESYNLNAFYTASPNTYKEGSIVFPIQDLPSGSYSGTLRVWDAHNNVTEAHIDFVVSDKKELFIFNSAAYPNPITEGQQLIFRFDHDREDEDLEVATLIYSNRGEIVRKETRTYPNSARTIEVPWSGITDGGQRLNEGIYYYRIIIQSNFDGATKEITQKLVVIN